MVYIQYQQVQVQIGLQVIMHSNLLSKKHSGPCLETDHNVVMLWVQSPQYYCSIFVILYCYAIFDAATNTVYVQATLGEVIIDPAAVLLKQQINLTNMPVGTAHVVFNAVDFGNFLVHPLMQEAVQEAVQVSTCGCKQ